MPDMNQLPGHPTCSEAAALAESTRLAAGGGINPRAALSEFQAILADGPCAEAP